MSIEKRKAIFLDRDGTINIDKEYLYKIEDFEFEPKACEALKILSDLGYLLIIVTNQSGVARGYYKEEDVELLHRDLLQILLEKGIKISKVYYCPHHPTKGIGKYKIDCDCRKPSPGMILNGIKDFNIDPSLSYMIGDKKSDVEAGIRACVSSVFLNNGKEKIDNNFPQDVLIFNSLYDFAIFLKKQSKKY